MPAQKRRGRSSASSQNTKRAKTSVVLYPSSQPSDDGAHASLRYKNKQQHVRLKQRSEQIRELNSQISTLRQQQNDFDYTLATIKSAWDELNDDLALILKRTEIDPLPDLAPSSREVEERPSHSLFLRHLLDSGAEKENFEDSEDDVDMTDIDPSQKLSEELKKRTAFTKQVLENVVEAIENQAQTNKRLWELVHGPNTESSQISEELTKTHEEISNKYDSIVQTNIELHEKLKTEKDGAKKYHKLFLSKSRRLSELEDELHKSKQTNQSLQRKLELAKGSTSSTASSSSSTSKTSDFDTKNSPLEGGETEIGDGEIREEIEDLRSLAVNRDKEIKALRQQYDDLYLISQRHIAEKDASQASSEGASFQNAVLKKEVEELRDKVKKANRIAFDQKQRQRNQEQYAEGKQLRRVQSLEADNRRFNERTAKYKKTYDRARLELRTMQEKFKNTKSVKELLILLDAKDEELKRLRRQNKRQKKELGPEGRKKVLMDQIKQKTLDASESPKMKIEEKTPDDWRKDLKKKDEEIERLRMMVSTLKTNDSDEREKTLLRFAEKQLMTKNKRLQTELKKLRQGTTPEEVEELKSKLDNEEEATRSMMTELDNVFKQFQEMQTQNARVVKQLTEVEDNNTQLITNQIQRSHQQKRHDQQNEILKKQLVLSKRTQDARNQHIAALEEKNKVLRKENRILRTSLSDSEQVSELSKMTAIDAETITTKLRMDIKKQHDSYKIMETELKRKIGQLSQYRERCKHLEEKRSKLSRKISRLQSGSTSAVNTGGEDDNEDKGQQQSKLLYYENLLRCQVCSQRQKKVIITKCFHMFCAECVNDNLKARHRKCPSCGGMFAHSDVRSFWF